MPRGDDVDGTSPLDLRLLIPALTGWATLTALITTATTALLAVAGCCLLLAVGSQVLLRRVGPVLPGWRHLPALTLVTTALLLVAGSAHLATDRAGPLEDLAGQRAVVRIEGTVLTEARVLQHGDERPDMVVLTLRVDQVVGRGQVSTVSSPVVVFADESWAEVSWRGRVSAWGRLGPADPGDDVVAAFTPADPPRLLDRPGPVLRGAEVARERLRTAVDPLPADARGLIPGLVIGDTSLTPPELTEAMLATGMSHLSAVSGSNVAIVLGAVVLVCGWLGVPRRWRPVVAVVCLVGFVILCRPEPSVLRAGAMGLVGLLALSRSRRRVSLPALATAVVVLLCVDPWLARSYGFALSTLATLGLVVFARPWGDAIAARLPRRVSLLGDAVAIPLAAQVVCGPVIVLLQGSVTTVAVLANLLAAPMVAPTTVAGVLAAVGAVVWAPLGSIAAWAGALPAWLIGRIARWCAVLPMGSIDWVDGPAGAWLLTALTLLVILAGPWLRSQAARRPLAAVAALVLAAALVWPPPDRGWPPPAWVVVGCDVGQGDAFVVTTGPGRAVVVDVGADPALIRACLANLGVRRVDALVLSHFHADHVGGLPGVLEHLPVGAAYLSPVREPAAEAEEAREALAEAGVPAYEVRAGDRLRWGAVSAHVVWPTGTIGTGSGANNGSVVLDLQAGPTRMLFTGDIEPTAAREVRHALAGQRFDVLKVAHHGSAAQDDELVRGSGARVALIGVGADNSFGHPTPSALALLRETGAVVLRTDLHGDVAVIADGPGLAVVIRGP